MHVVVVGHVTDVAGVDPKFTSVVPGTVSKLTPEIVTRVPPLVGPLVGAMASGTGGRSTNVDAALPELDWPATLTITVCGPRPGGEMATHVVVEQVATDAAIPPKVTVVAPGVASKPLPVIVTGVPPPAGPDGGEMEVTTGAGVDA